MKTWRIGGSQRRAVEIVFLVLLAIIVWGLFSLPTVFYLRSKTSKTFNRTNCLLSTTESSNESNLTSNSYGCSENFIFIGNLCLASCPNWVLRRKGENADDIILITAAVVGLTCGILVLLVSALRHRRMFVFPSTLVVYQTGTAVLLIIFAIIGFINPTALYCTAPDWITSLRHSTPFCSISGSVLFYCFMQIAVLWICHVCMIFWNVRFPEYYLLLTRRHQLKYIHLMTVLIAIFLPCIPVAVVFGTGGFINARFPPSLCISKSADAAFFSLVLPVSILIASGVSLLLAVFWTLHKQHEIQRERMSKSPMKLGTAEKKIIIVFSYYLLLEVVALASFIQNTQTSDEFTDSLSSYFACESKLPGHCDCYRNSALQFTFSGLSDTAYILFALYPLVNLVYAVEFNELKKHIVLLFQAKSTARDSTRAESKIEPITTM